MQRNALTIYPVCITAIQVGKYHFLWPLLKILACINNPECARDHILGSQENKCPYVNMKSC